MKEKSAWIGGFLNLLILAVVLTVVQVSCQTTMPTPATAVATTHISVASTTAAPATPTVPFPPTLTSTPTAASPVTVTPTLTYTPIPTVVVVLSTNESLAQGSHSYEREYVACSGVEARIETISFEFVSSDQLKLTTNTTFLVGYGGNYSRVSQDYWYGGAKEAFYITFRLEGFDMEHEEYPGCKVLYRRLD